MQAVLGGGAACEWFANRSGFIDRSDFVSQIDGIPGESEYGYGKPASGVSLDVIAFALSRERSHRRVDDSTLIQLCPRTPHYLTHGCSADGVVVPGRNAR